MPRRKIPPEALTFYLGLGPGRSYQKVAEKYGVTKRAVTKLAAKERWQEKVAEIERSARESAEEQVKSEYEVAYKRHMKALRMVFAKGVQGLSQMVIDTPADAMKAIQMAIREERVALGEPTDRTAVSIEDTIKREYERWMVVDEEQPDLPSDKDSDDEKPDEGGRRRPGGAS